MSGLELYDVTVEYDKFCLSGVSFTCNPGEIVAFVGKNGAGKTTTINAILSLVKKKSGRVMYKGEEINDQNVHKFKQIVGCVGSSTDYYPKIQTQKVINLLSGVYKEWNHDVINHYLEAFQIDTSKKMIELSMGTKVKLGLAIALSHSAELFLLDEPTTGLDPIVREQVLSILSTLARDHDAAVFFSTHITQDIEKIASRIIFIVNGIIKLDIKKEDLYARFVKIPIDRIPDNAKYIIGKGILLNGQYVIIETNDVPKEILQNVKDKAALLIEDVLFYLNGGIA